MPWTRKDSLYQCVDLGEWGSAYKINIVMLPKIDLGNPPPPPTHTHTPGKQIYHSDPTIQNSGASPGWQYTCILSTSQKRIIGWHIYSGIDYKSLKGRENDTADWFNGTKLPARSLPVPLNLSPCTSLVHGCFFLFLTKFLSGFRSSFFKTFKGQGHWMISRF